MRTPQRVVTRLGDCGNLCTRSVRVAAGVPEASPAHESTTTASGQTSDVKTLHAWTGGGEERRAVSSGVLTIPSDGVLTIPAETETSHLSCSASWPAMYKLSKQT